MYHLIGDMRKRMLFSDDDRRKHRQKHHFKIIFQILLLLYTEICKCALLDSLLFQFFRNIRKDLIPQSVQGIHPFRYLCQLLIRCQIGTDVVMMVMDDTHFMNAPHSDHIKLIQVVCKYFQKF